LKQNFLQNYFFDQFQKSNFLLVEKFKKNCVGWFFNLYLKSWIVILGTYLKGHFNWESRCCGLRPNHSFWNYKEYFHKMCFQRVSLIFSISIYKSDCLYLCPLFTPEPPDQSPPNFAQTTPPTQERFLTQAWPHQPNPLTPNSKTQMGHGRENFV